MLGVALLRYRWIHADALLLKAWSSNARDQLTRVGGRRSNG
jgi:hypothetical protein